MWHLDHELEAHFDRIRADRGGRDRDEHVPTTQNQYTAGLRR